MKLFRILLVVVVAALGVAALLVVRQRQRLAAMSDDEIRAMLEGKLSGKLDDEQLVRIQEIVIARVRGGRWSSSSSAAAITGTVSYRESDPMPPSAVVIVTLADTSVTDAAGQIGAHVIEQPKTVPVDFSVGFDPADIIDNHSYTVEATISSGDALLWTTDTAYPVITRGNPLTADLLLIAVPSSVEQ